MWFFPPYKWYSEKQNRSPVVNSTASVCPLDVSRAASIRLHSAPPGERRFSCPWCSANALRMRLEPYRCGRAPPASIRWRGLQPPRTRTLFPGATASEGPLHGGRTVTPISLQMGSRGSFSDALSLLKQGSRRQTVSYIFRIFQRTLSPVGPQNTDYIKKQNILGKIDSERQNLLRCQHKNHTLVLFFQTPDDFPRTIMWAMSMWHQQNLV